jgi:DNA-binding MarR family transcriptional regulator
MKWLAPIAEYWKSEHPERNFARVRPLVRLARLATVLPAFQRNVLKPHELTPTDYSILGALQRAGRPRQLMPGDLYNTLGCTPGGLTKMIDRLVKRGLVQRLSDREDGRRARIRLTPKGELIGSKAFDDYNDAAEHLLSRLTEEELAHIDSALELLLGCFEPEEEQTYVSPFSAAGSRARPASGAAGGLRAEARAPR